MNRWPVNMLILLAAAITIGLPNCKLLLAQPMAADDRVLLHFNQTALLGGRWSFVRDLQSALSGALLACGGAPVDVDGTFGRGSQKAVTRLGNCPGYGDLEIGAGQRQAGIVTEGLWRKLLPGQPVPDALQRSHVIWLTHEATDYGRAEFNFTSAGEPQANDKLSYLTWGPFGATVGHGREVQKILAMQEVNANLGPCFDEEASVVRDLLTASDTEARETLQQVVVSSTRRERWSAGFLCLGSKPEVRAAYDSFALDTGQWLKPALSRLETLVGPDPVSEIDYAFFVDLAMHMSISPKRIDAVRQALADHRHNGGGDLSPSERRQIIGQTLVSMLSNQVEDRRGRNVVFYIDGLGTDRLSAQEMAAWKHRSAIKASDVGLADAPIGH